MKKSRIAYIVLTVLFCLLMAPGAIMDLVQPDMVVEITEGLGLPLYVLTLMGIWKILGFVALAIPGLQRIKEWAYAGFFFDLTGASFCHGASGDWPGVFPPLVLLSLGAGSYLLWRKTTAPA